MVKRPINRVDGDETALLEIENGKFSAFRGPAGNNAIVSIRNAGHLQLDLELIRPKPGQRSISASPPSDCGGDALRLVGCVLHGFQPDPCASKFTGVLGAISNGKNVFVVSLQILIYGDAVCGAKPSVAGELVIWNDTHSDQHHLPGDLIPSTHQISSHLSARALHLRT